MLRKKEMVDCLAETALFQGCPVELSGLLGRTYEKGQFVQDTVDGTPCIGVVASGTIEVYGVASDGSEVNLNTLQRGDSFGICNVFAPSSLTTLLQCRSKAEVVFVPKQVFLQLLQKMPDLAERYGALCNQKIQFLIAKIELYSMQSCRNKLIQYLLSNQNQQGRINLGCSKEQLAKKLGVSRAALFRELTCLQNRGCISVNGDFITILAKEKLEAVFYEKA